MDSVTIKDQVIKKAMICTEVVRGVLLDIEKEYDTVCMDEILIKLLWCRYKREKVLLDKAFLK